MLPKFPPVLVLLAAFGAPAGAGAAEALSPPAPLVNAASAAPSPGEDMLTLSAAQRAQELGLPALAAGLYRQLLAAPGGGAGGRASLRLALVTALLDEGDVAAAGAALQEQPAALRDSAWHLRAALVAAHEKKTDAAKAEFAAVKREELQPADAAWLLFLQGMLANIASDGNRSLYFYDQAVAAAQAGPSRARFLIARDLARLKLGTVRQDDIEAGRKRVEAYEGKSGGYALIRDYAIELDAFGEKAAAVELLNRELRSLPPDEHGWQDNFQLLLGLVAGAADGVGRNALTQLIAGGTNREEQEAALQLLARASRSGPARAEFRRRLDELIAAPKPSPIYEDLLALRAQLALEEKDDARAEKDANTLLDNFPGSPFKAQALGVLTSAAWERRFYQTAANYAARARDELKLPEGRETRAELGLLIAEARFRAEDYRGAADAYKAVLEDPPADVAVGRLTFQRVVAEIDAAQSDGRKLEAIEPILDALARSPDFDPVDRWRAEWNLAAALATAGETGAAYARVNALLAAGSPAPPEYRARLSWLQVQLSLEAGQPQETLRLADALAGGMEGLEPRLRTEIASDAMLFKAQADFVLGRETDALQVLEQLHRDFPASTAAVRSYIIQAEYYEQKDNLGKAQSLLTTLMSAFPRSSLVPEAAFNAARLAAKLGQDRAAIAGYERLITDHPESDLVFRARLAEGDLYMKLNDFPHAQGIYKDIIARFPQDPNIRAADLALANCYAAQAAGDAAYADRAREQYERLLALPSAPADMRVQAGFNLGINLVRRGDTKRAEDIWWRDVITAFLLDKPGAAAQLGATGRYWMARTILELGDLFRKEDRLEEARRVWSLMLEAKLPARDAALERLGPKPAEPPP